MGVEVDVKAQGPAGPESGPLARLGEALADFCERYFPDAFVFALCAVIIVFLGGLALGEKPLKLVQVFGEGFWVLIPFTMQMALIIIGGFVVASSPPGGPADRVVGRGAQDAPGGRGLRRPPGHAQLADFLGVVPDLHRPAGPGSSQAGAADRLPGHRRRGLPRPGGGLGPGPVVLGGAPAKHQRLHTAGPVKSHRGHPADPDHLSVAEPADWPPFSSPFPWPWPISPARAPKRPRPRRIWGSPSSRWK